jgi:hypothetical protein
MELATLYGTVRRRAALTLLWHRFAGRRLHHLAARRREAGSACGEMLVQCVVRDADETVCCDDLELSYTADSRLNTLAWHIMHWPPHGMQSVGALRKPGQVPSNACPPGRSHTIVNANQCHPCNLELLSPCWPTALAPRGAAHACPGAQYPSPGVHAAAAATLRAGRDWALNRRRLA